LLFELPTLFFWRKYWVETKLWRKTGENQQKFCLRVSKKTIYWGSDVLQQV
jgi:hypothetical protein